MSTYNWESGTIVIPTDQYRGFRKSMIEAWNKREQMILNIAEEVYTAIKEKRLTCNPTDSWEETVTEHLTARHYDEDTSERVYKLLFLKWEELTPPQGYQGKSYGQFKHLVKPQAPKKKSLKLLPPSKAATLSYDECSISFNDKEHSVRWSVSENNHAVERAHEHHFTKTLFVALAGINWKRGSGGTIVGNDEYNRDSESEGGGGNYITRSFGAKEERQNTYGGGFGHGFMGGRRY